MRKRPRARRRSGGIALRLLDRPPRVERAPISQLVGLSRSSRERLAHAAGSLAVHGCFVSLPACEETTMVVERASAMR
jgi:hypothetical protein